MTFPLHRASSLVACLLALGLGGCPAPRDASHAQGRASCPTGQLAVIRSELMFGLRRAAGDAIGEEEFAAFFAREVAERFSGGATLLDAEGRYRDASGALIAERSKLVIWLHADSPRDELAIEAVRARYREQFAQESVLRADVRACAFY